jgi:hypothetical protein
LVAAVHKKIKPVSKDTSERHFQARWGSRIVTA